LITAGRGPNQCIQYYGLGVRSPANASRARLIVAVVAPLVVGLLLCAWLVTDQRQRVRLQADEAVRATVAGAVGQVRTAIRDQASTATAGPQPGDRTVPVADVAGSGLSLDITALARDSGTAVLDDTLTPASIVVAVYGSGSAPQDTEQRRQQITGYRVVPLALNPVITGLASGSGGLVVRGPNRVVATTNGTAPSGAPRFGVDMQMSDTPGWVVQSWLPSPATPGVTWFWALAILVLFAGISAVLGYFVRQQSRLAAHQRQLERDRVLVTGIAPVLQASLDMGEVLPAVSSHLADGLALAGLSLSTPSATGERQVFGWGVAPDASVSPLLTPPERLESGATFALSLTRGGRVLGVLRVVCGEPLNREDLLALATASELVGSTFANAEAYTRQQELLERMRSVDELKTVFLATASHELRTPVTAIVGFSSLLLGQWDGMTPEQGRGLMERVLSNGRRLETLIEQLLDFSRLERGLPKTGEELLDLGRTVRKILTDQPELTAKHTLDLRLGEECVVRGSTAAVERIVTNLVGNAAKYAPPETKITVTVWAEADRIQLIVDDEGAGVAPKDRQRVFSRFYRGRSDAVSSTKGVGIGLAIVAEYAATMSGVASVSSAPSGGARFSVSFPAVRVLAGVAREGEHDVAVS
jgi:signal transduction histidine kinase